MKKCIGIILAFVVWGVAGAQAGPAENERDWAKYPVNEGPFERSLESLNQWECPDWFRDSKLGIWMHWGPQAVPMQGDWYAYGMYIQGHHNYKHHVKTYGHPSEFGYKDIIKLFNPTEMDFEERVKMYTDAGAKYVVMLACHHDNFDMWDSKHHEWDAVEKGPGRDLVGEFAAAARKAGVRYGLSHHNDKAIGWMQGSHKSDSKGPMKGVPYDGTDPEYESLYCPPYKNDNPVWSRVPINPPEWWELNWYQRTKDVIDNYQPDLFYFDGTLPFQHDDFAVGRQFLANYYNGNVKKNGGKLDAVMCLKDSRRTDLSVPDYERRGLPGINQVAWQTDTCIGNWYYNENAVRFYKTPEQVAFMLVDIVSKNGNLLLSVPVHPSGEPQPPELAFLKGLGEWMKVNGKGIYGTRPWLVYGEGDLESTNYGIGGMHESNVELKEGDYRFTSKGETDVFAFFTIWPEKGTASIVSLANHSTDKASIKRVTLLGSDEPLDFKWERGGLKIKLPAQKPYAHTWGLHIEGEGLRNFKVPAPKQDVFVAHTAPCVIQAVHYDKGTQTVSYHDTTEGNQGGAFRKDDVDISEKDGTPVVTQIENGEWLEYTLGTELGIYDIGAKVSGGESGGRIGLFLNDELLGSAGIPAGQELAAVRVAKEVTLRKSSNAVLRVVFQGSNLSFDSLAFKKTGLPPTVEVYLSDMEWNDYKGPPHRHPAKDRDRDGDPLLINGVRYEKGLGCDSQMQIIYDLEGRCVRFLSDVGVDDDMDFDGCPASVKFHVYLDGKLAYDSGLMTWKTATKKIDLDVTGVKELKLVVDDAGNGRNSDHADWGDARVIRKTKK